MGRRAFRADAVMAGLTGFQRDTVEHVISRFYGDAPATRFLVADETGLGKTIVAKGVIARAIEELEHDDTVQRIDVVYVCSNADIARQNLEKLTVTDEPQQAFASRLTLLAKHGRHLAPRDGSFIKPVNVISFTPGTSFERGWRLGNAEERAMLYLLLREPMGLSGRRSTAAARVLQGAVQTLDGFRRRIADLEAALGGEIDPTVSGAFLRAARKERLIARMEVLVDAVQGRPSVPTALNGEVTDVIGSMRAVLARESVELVEPDLVILDEFQRFRQLLDPTTEAGALAHHLFEHPQARVLLLSATPYKPFTYAEEGADDHHTNFMETIRFLAAGGNPGTADEVSEALRSYRQALLSGDPRQAGERVRASLLPVMVRNERPKSVGATMLRERVDVAQGLRSEDLLGFVALQELATEVDADMSVEYWKSAPYFANFIDGYRLGDRVREALKDPARRKRVRTLWKSTQRLSAEALRRFDPVDPGHPRLRDLAHETVDAGWWQLLWVPPSLPYLAPGGPFAEPFAQKVTKRLVFSSWNATPTAVSALLSYEADRRIAEGTRLAENTPEGRQAITSRLTYRVDDRGRPQSMTTLALFLPLPALAEVADPRKHRRRMGGDLTASALRAAVAERLLRSTPRAARPSDEARAHPWWRHAFGWQGALPGGTTEDEIVSAMRGTDDSTQDADELGLRAHVAEALAGPSSTALPELDNDEVSALADLAAHSPGNIAYRSLGRLSGESPYVTPQGHWAAAAALADALRSLFSRPEAILLLDRLTGSGGREIPFWRAVLTYCAWGNLQAVLDEYLHHLAKAEGARALDDTRLLQLATTAGAAIGLQRPTYRAFDADEPDLAIRFAPRFALRYGGRDHDDTSVRLPLVRQAFNSPFWPMVLASTSIGQEGIDFHWWCHSITHWNTPTNPVDFEQREGRVDRYDGHAIRRNICERHGEAMLASGEDDPWLAAYRLAEDEHARLGEFAPHWVYPGSTRIERRVMPFALSIDEPRLTRVREDVAWYRLTFGQPRQEDMLAALRSDRPLTDGELEAARIDLRAPRRGSGATS